MNKSKQLTRQIQNRQGRYCSSLPHGSQRLSSQQASAKPSLHIQGRKQQYTGTLTEKANSYFRSQLSKVWREISYNLFFWGKRQNLLKLGNKGLEISIWRGPQRSPRPTVSFCRWGPRRWRDLLQGHTANKEKELSPDPMLSTCPLHSNQFFNSRDIYKWPALCQAPWGYLREWRQRWMKLSLPSMSAHSTEGKILLWKQANTK